MEDQLELAIENAAKKADETYNFTEHVRGLGGVVMEIADKALFQAVLTVGASVIPEEYHQDYLALLESYVAGDFTTFSLAMAERLNANIDIPFIDETSEELLFRTLLSGFVNDQLNKLAA